MKFKLIFHPEAEDEFNEAILWYTSQQKGLELEFVHCIDESLQKYKDIRSFIPLNLKTLERKL